MKGIRSKISGDRHQPSWCSFSLVFLLFFPFVLCGNQPPLLLISSRLASASSRAAEGATLRELRIVTIVSPHFAMTCREISKDTGSFHLSFPGQGSLMSRNLDIRWMKFSSQI
jgi:hypothetical protein